MSTNQRAAGSAFTVTRMVTNAVLIAMYGILSSFLTIKIPNVTQISLSSLPVIIAGMLFGPIDGFVVGLGGGFIEQLLYGLSPTAPLWIIPAAVQGLFVGCAAHFFRKPLNTPLTVTVIVIGEVLLTALNTAALYIDARIMKYNVKALYLLVPPRAVSCLLRAVITSALVLLLIETIRKTLGVKRTK